MKRGDLYLVKHPTSTDPRRQRAFVVVSRQALIDSSFSTVVCAPMLVSLLKGQLTNFLGALSTGKLFELDRALSIALDVVSR